MAGRPVVSAWITQRSVEIVAKKLCTAVLTSSSLKSDLEDRAQALVDYLNVNDDLDITHGINPYRVINVKQWKVLPFKNYTANQYRVSFILPIHNDQPPTRISYTPADNPFSLFDESGNMKSYSQRMEEHEKMKKKVKTYHWVVANMAAVRLGKGGQDVVYPKKSSTLVWFTKNGRPIFRKHRMKFGLNAGSGHSQYRRFIISSIERFFGHSIGVGNLSSNLPTSNKMYEYGIEKAHLKLKMDTESNSRWENSMLGKDVGHNTMFTPDGNYKSYSDRMTINQFRMARR